MSRVLVVDDHPDEAILLAEGLCELGYDASAITDPLRVIAELDRGYDAIVLDVAMPGLDGLALLDRIRDDERRAALVAVFLTASEATVESLGRAMDGGARGYLVKPQSPVAVASAIADALVQQRLEVRAANAVAWGISVEDVDDLEAVIADVRADLAAARRDAAAVHREIASLRRIHHASSLSTV